MCYDCRLLFPTVAMRDEHVCREVKNEEEQEGQLSVYPKPITSRQLKDYEMLKMNMSTTDTKDSEEKKK